MFNKMWLHDVENEQNTNIQQQWTAMCMAQKSYKQMLDKITCNI